MQTRSKRAATVTVAALLLALPVTLAAGCKKAGGDYRDQCRAVGWWPALLADPPQPIRLRLEPSVTEDPRVAATVRRAAGEWTEATGGRVRWEEIDAGPPGTGGADVTVRLLPLSRAHGGWTRMERVGGATAPAGRLLSVTVSLAPEEARHEEIVVHELGHALGIDGHSSNPGDVMNEETRKTRPSRRDVNTLLKIYQEGRDWEEERGAN